MKLDKKIKQLLLPGAPNALRVALAMGLDRILNDE
jgi:hypothetical protein